MINCALSRTTIEKLYKSVYKHMSDAVNNNTSFNALDYISYVYANKSASSSPENAAKLVQHVPRIIIDVYNSDFIENQNFDIDLGELNRLTKQFLNPETGVLDIISKYKESSLKFLRKIANTKEQEIGFPDQIDSETETVVFKASERLMPYSALTGTSQELLAADPTELSIEKIDESKKYIYTTLKAIKDAVGNASPSSVLDNLEYQGVKLQVKAVKLNSIDQSELDDYTRNLIVRSRSIQKTGKQQTGVTPADKLAIIIVSDNEGNFVYFDDNGNITTKEDGGKLVYQFLRNVSKKGNNFNVSNIYGYKSVLSPIEIVKSLKLPEEMVDEIAREQQEEFKELYDLQSKVVDNNEEILMPISGISNGVLYSYLGKEVSLSELAKFSDIDKSVYKSIETIENDRGLLKKGFAAITINGAEFPIDRVDVPEAITQEVAAVLTDKNLPFFVRYEFYNQFFNNKIDIRARRHYTSVNMETAELVFNYSNQTHQQNPGRKLTDNSIDLSDAAIINKSPEELNQLAGNIAEVLRKGKGKDGRFFPTKMTFNAKSLQNETYMRYNLQTKEILNNEDYIDFVKSLPAKVKLAIIDKDVFNSYIHFGVPSQLSNDIQEIKKEMDKDTRGPIRQTKDSLVDMIKKDGSIDTSVVSRKSGEYMGKDYANFQIAIPGQEETAKVYFPNKSTKVDVAGERVEDPNWPAQGQEVRLELRDELVVDGKVFNNVIEVFRLYPDGTKGAYIGVIAERDISEFREDSVPEEAEDATVQPVTNIVEEVQEEVDYVEKVNPVVNTDTPTEASDILSRNWKGLKRSITLNSNVTEQEIKDAETWWKNSPLAYNPQTKKGYISFEKITNIVNSDAYASFVTSSADVYNSAVLGQIKVYEPIYGPKGTMVDVYHEAWHGFTQLFLTKEEKQKLYDEASETLNTKDYLVIEEQLAEDFREFARNKGKVPGSKTKKSIFQKILDFLYQLFTGGKKNVSQNQTPFTARMSQYPKMVHELFDKLYFGDKSNLKLNDYSPSINNVMFDQLNRGVEKADQPKDDALSRQDSMIIVDSMDSVFSNMIDQLNKGFGAKAATTKALIDPDNKAIAYEEIKKIFQRKVSEFKEQLGPINKTSFNNFKTVADLEANAAAVIRHKKGDHKYIFLASQVEDFTNLSPDTKSGQRIKGQDYFGIKIVSDFYEHKNIVLPTGEKADIIVADNIRNAAIQYNNYIDAEGTKNFESFELRAEPEVKDLSYEEEQILNNIRILQTSLDNWSSVIKYHKDNSRFDIIKEDFTEEEIVELDADGNPVDETSAEGSADSIVKTGEVGKKSLDQLAQKEVLYIMKSLFKVENGKRTKNKLGFDELADFPRLWKIVTREIGTIKDINQMYDRLVEAASTHAPELKQLVEDKLANPTTLNRENISPSAAAAEFSVLTSFWQTFSRPRVKYYQVTAWPERKVDEFSVNQDKGDVVGFTFDVLDASIDASNVIRKFEAKFNSATYAENKYITRVDNINSLSKLQDIVKDFGNPYSPGNLNIDKQFEFAKVLGIAFDDVAAIKDELKRKPDDYGLPYLFKMVYDIAGIQAKKQPTGPEVNLLNEFMTNPLQVFMKKIAGNLFPSFKTSEVYQRSIIKKLAELQGRYGYESSNYSVLNPEKNLVNEFIDDHSISRIVDGINRAEKRTDLWTKKELKYLSWLNPQINTFTNRSQILNSIFKKSGEQERYKDKDLELFIDSGTSIAEFDTGTVTTSLDIYSKFLQEMHMMLKGGIQEFIRHASKKSSFGVKVNGGILGYAGKGKDGKLYVDLEMFSPERSQFTESYIVDNIMIPYLASEFHRIIKFKNNTDQFKNYIGYNRNVGTKENPVYAGEVFGAFDNVLTDKLKSDLLDPEFLTKFSSSDMTFEDYLKQDLNLKARIKNDVINYFGEQTGKNIEVLNQSKYIDKELIDNINTTKKLSPNEQAEIVVKAYTVNSWIHNFETINLFYGDLAQFNHAKEEMHKRNTGSTSGGPKFLTGPVAENFINNFWNKETYASKYAARTGKSEYNKFTNFNSTINTAVIKDIKRSSEYLKDIKAALEKDYRSRPGWSEERIQNALQTDLKTYEEMNEADGAGYISIDAYRTLKKLENAWSMQQEQLYQKIINNHPIKASDVVNFFPVYKVQYFGALADTIAPVTAMHKFALAPLIPSEIKGSELEKLHHEMLRNNIQYVTFESGSKVGTVTENGKLDDVFTDDTQKTVKDSIEFKPNTIYLEFLKVATSVNAKYKGETTFPTQLRGLILDGLYNEGKISKAKYEELGKEYHQLVADYTETLKLELLNEIGFEERGGKYYGNFTEFMGMLQRELGKRDMPDHLLRMIGTTPDGKVKTDLSIHIEADAIEKMLLSVLTKRLVKQKVKGEALIQVPSSMYNGLWDRTVKLEKADEEYTKKYLGTNNLPFYRPGKDGTNAMKIAIALQGDFVNLFKLKYNGKEIGDIDTLNTAVKDDKWLNEGDNRKAISLTGARIPIQNLNSMEFAEVWHFLDPSAGNKVVVPTELVAKAGSDFDVDKIFWMMPYIDREGVYVKDEYTQDELKKLIKDKKFASKAIKHQKRALENKLIEYNQKILSTPDNYVSLIRPNHTYLVKEYADKYAEFMESYNRYENMHGEAIKLDPEKKKKKQISPTRVLEVQYNLHKHDVNMVGKDTLGIVALQNKKHPILKSVGAAMPATYKSQKYDDRSKTYYDTFRTFDMRLLLPHNKLKDKDGNDRISLSSNYNVDGDRIADIYSHVMNGLLDVEKDAWVFYIQANLEEVGVLNYLLEAGVPAETAILFVSQPMMREYALNQKMLKSTYKTIMNKSAVAFPLVKYKAAEEVLRKVPKQKKDEILFQANYKNLNSIKIQKDDQYIVNAGITGDKQYSGSELLQELRSGELNINNLYTIRNTKDEAENFMYEKIRSLISNAGYYDAALIASSAEGVLDKGEFSKEMLEKIIKNPDNPETADFQLASFLHLLEIEKQIKGLESVKRQSNPDTKLLKAVYQIKKRTQQYVDSIDNSKIDTEFVEKLRNESILSSFYVNDIAVDLIEPVMPLRMNNTVMDFVSDKLGSDLDRIQSKFGTGIDGEERFVSEYNNALVNYIFQNFMSNFINQDGTVTNLPTSYREMEIVKKPGVTNGVQIEGDIMYVDSKMLTNDFKAQKFLDSYKGADNYTSRGLAPFKNYDNPFPSQASYNRYVIEREYLRTLYPNTGITAEEKLKHEKMLNQRTLLNVFNRDVVMGTSSEYAYTDLVMSTIKEFSHLKSRYPVLEQISKLMRKKSKILQLNDRDFAKGDLAESYYQNLRELADPYIQKVKDPEGNRKLSEVFQLFSLMALHQHGVGYNKYGFNKILDDSDYTEVMRSASAIFAKNSINQESLTFIFDTLINDQADRFFKNYVRDPAKVNERTLERNKNTVSVVNFINSITDDYGQNTVNDAIQTQFPELSIIDVPENVDVNSFMNEEYSDYVPATYETITIMLDRLLRNGAPVDKADFLFYDFATDTSYSAAETISLLKQVDESIMPEEETIEEEISESTETLKTEVPSADKNSGLYPTITEFYNSLTKMDRQKLGNLDDLINNYANMYSEFFTEEEYIETKRCEL
jgi:hypothetical protein